MPSAAVTLHRAECCMHTYEEIVPSKGLICQKHQPLEIALLK
jgi:hypothetical protein